MRRLIAAALLAFAGVAHAQSAPPQALPEGMTAEQVERLVRSERFRTLAAELRCLVCQNQTLADSNADLAVDLRNEVLRQMAAGKDDAQIKSHLVARYGEFVLYRPTFSVRNLALWAGPAVLLAIGATVLWRTSRRRDAPPPPAAGGDVDARLARVDRLLDDDAPSPR
jgi:cytochrome c-type biogenesis protein CcmH